MIHFGGQSREKRGRNQKITDMTGIGVRSLAALRMTMWVGMAMDREDAGWKSGVLDFCHSEGAERPKNPELGLPS